jgi:surface antigen
MKAWKVFIVLTSFLMGSAFATTGREDFKETAFARFTDADRSLMMARVGEALRAKDEGGALEWSNGKTGASGSVTPLNRLEWGGMSCRRLHIVNTYGRTTGKGVYKFCQKSAGGWKLVGPD